MALDDVDGDGHVDTGEPRQDADPLPGAVALPQQGTASHNAVRCTLPHFWPNSPHMWFRRVESQFELSHVTQSRTKAALVFTQLDEVAAGFVNDVSLDSPHPYETLKAALMAACGKTKRQRVAELIDGPTMGAETPERFAVRLTQLAEGLDIGDVIREAFLRGLPRDVAKTLVNTEGDFGELARKAGSFFTSSGASIASTSAYLPPPHAFSDPPYLDDLCLEEPQASASAAWPRRSRPSDARPPRQQPDDRRPSYPRQQRSGDARAPHYRQERPAETRASGSRQGGGDVESRLCAYHAKWGHRAHKCERPCAWSGNAPASNRR